MSEIDFSDGENITDKECCSNCYWFCDEYPNAEYGLCMVDPPAAVIMKDREDKDVVRTVHPSPKYPDIDFCSRFKRKKTL